MKLDMPMSTILYRKVKRIEHNSYEITYEFGWATSLKADSAKRYSSRNFTDAYLNLPHGCFSKISVSFDSSRRA